MLPTPPSSAAEPVFTVLDEARLYDLPPGDGESLTFAVVLLGGGIDPDDPSFDTYCQALGVPRPTIRVIEAGGAANTPCPYSVLAPALVKTGSGTTGTPRVHDQAPAAVTVSSLPGVAKARALVAKILPPGVKPPWELLHDHEVPDHVHAHITKLHAAADLLASLSPGAAAPVNLKDALQAMPWTFEGMMDLQLAIPLVPKATFLVVVAPQTDAGLAAAIQAAADAGADVISNSFSYGEGSGWTASEAAIQAAVGKGITITASSGNKGSTFDGATLSVGYPATSPLVLACGGTALLNHGADEVVWNDDHGPKASASGGGFSTLFGRPAWQAAANPGPQRGVPDVAANASQHSGCWIWFQDPKSDPTSPTGVNSVSFGTSSSAPVWGATILRFVQDLGTRLGAVQPLLYSDPVRAAGFQSVTTGTNAIVASTTDYVAQPHWDPCTGLGRPHGKALLAAIRTALGR